nr:hypothetical protein [Cohnella zeiphila]
MTFDLTAEPRLNDPIYRYSFLAFAQTSFAAASVGVGRHFLEECAEFAASKAPEWKETSPRRLAALESAVAERLGILEAASDRFYELAESSWDTFVREGTLPEEVWREIGRRSQEAAAAARSGSDAVFPLLGMTALRHDHALCRTWRDLHTVTQHSVLLPENEE